MFKTRHIDTESTSQKLSLLGCNTIDELINKVVPESIRLQHPLTLDQPVTESDILQSLRKKAQLNSVFKSFIGQGYYGTHTPSVILRHIFENPGWYTAYTPYQAEISQGRLEMLFNFQTMITELTGLDVANASLLDEATAAAEAMTLLYRSRDRHKNDSSVFFVDSQVFPQTIDILKTRATPMGITIEVGDIAHYKPTQQHFGVFIQYPNQLGEILCYQSLCSTCHDHGIKVAVATDLLALVLLKPPGHWGADVAIGNSQRFGVPLGFGGPHAAFIATKSHYQRQLPGRLIGLSKDRLNQPAYRMALQTREQHIRREKATSNICTAQALLAVMAAAYAMYHGPKGLKRIANQVHDYTCLLAKSLSPINQVFFDTICVAVEDATALKVAAEKKGYNFRYLSDNRVCISIDETTTQDDINAIVSLFKLSVGYSRPVLPERTDRILSQTAFNSYHTETELMRHLKQLENKDLSLTHAMIPLGSCTMKLNAATLMMPLSWPEFSSIHPFAPVNQTRGYQSIITELENDIATITGFNAVSLEPNSGAQGELAGLLAIKNYQAAQGESKRTISLIPTSAHGTNPASAAMAGFDIKLIKCDDQGNIDLDDLTQKATEYKDTLSNLMITYPSTHGVFESEIKKICGIIHTNGGQVYMDGANLNAQVGLTSPAEIGADVCHLNLHKTFAIPHGGGGPGVGPIAVAAHLADHIPSVSAAPYGSASILLISYAYIKLLGADGLTEATKQAILNANYIKAKLEPFYSVLFTGKHNYVAHELIIDCRSFKKTKNIDVEDIAKRLIDYGFHAPTMSWPVPGTLMIEPTESESIQELDRFCDAMINIKGEIEDIQDLTRNVLKHAPHPIQELKGDEWPHGYSRKQASRTNVFYSSVARVDNAYGDRNLHCSCPPIETYETAVVQ